MLGNERHAATLPRHDYTGSLETGCWWLKEQQSGIGDNRPKARRTWVISRDRIQPETYWDWGLGLRYGRLGRDQRIVCAVKTGAAGGRLPSAEAGSACVCAWGIRIPRGPNFLMSRKIIKNRMWRYSDSHPAFLSARFARGSEWQLPCATPFVTTAFLRCAISGSSGGGWRRAGRPSIKAMASRAGLGALGTDRRLAGPSSCAMAVIDGYRNGWFGPIAGICRARRNRFRDQWTPSA